MATAIPQRRIVSVYEPTVTGLPPLRRYFTDVWERRNFIWHMARTEMKAQHYDTTMGVAWLVLDPLLMALTLFIIRLVLKPAGGSAHASYVIAYIIMAVSFFYVVRDIVTGAALSIVRNKSMVLNCAAPRLCFPLVSVVRGICDLGPALLVYLVFHTLTGQPWGLSLVFLPLVLTLLVIFSLGFGLLLAPLVVYFRDVGTLLPYVVRIWMYLTPVMFAVVEIPKSLAGIFVWNPLYQYFAMLDQIFQAKAPSATYMLIGTFWAVLFGAAGMVAFLLRERDYAIRL